MPSCAIATCKNYYSKGCKDREINFFTFPKNRELCDKWIVLCRRQDEINCSDHFANEDFKRNLKAELIDLR